MSRKGVTLIELLVVLIIVGLILGAVYATYINLLKGFKKGTEATASEVENLVGLEVLRLDIEHMGYGLPDSESKPIVEWDSSSKRLVLRSTLNNTSESTIGYLIAKCESGELNIQIDGREDSSANYVSILQASSKDFLSKGTVSGSKISLPSGVSCSNGEIYIAFPVRDTVYNGSSNGCSVGLCEEIVYELSASNLISRCNVNTYNLVRRLGTSSTTGEPVLNCVADWKVTFDIDQNDNGILESTETDLSSPPSTNEDIRDKLKRVNIYLLVQEGRYDPDYTFSQVTNCGSNKCVAIGGIELKLPSGYENYRWKAIKLSVKPMGI